MNKAGLFLILSMSFFSCNLVTFQDEDVSCSLGADVSNFTGQAVYFNFSSSPDHYQAEQCISLQSDSRAVELEFSWEGKTLSVKPSGAWEKGKNYHLSCNGTVTINTSRVSVSIERTFMYGDFSQQLIFEKSQSILAPENQKDCLLFIFNKPLEQSSFTENFSISPGIEKNIIFSSDNKSVQIKPKISWGINTLYTWSFKNLKSADGYFYKITESSSFIPLEDTELPKLQSVCPVKNIAGIQTVAAGQELDSNVQEKEPIAFIFSKSMDFDSVKAGISLTPSISGYFEQLDLEGKQFIFIPTQMYTIKQRYEISISSSISDSHGLSLFQENKIYFTPGGDYLTLREISAGTQNLELSQTDSIPVTITKNLSNKYELTVNLLFSTQIQKEKRSQVAKQVNLSLLFPLTSESPVQTQIKWNNSGTLLSLTWENFTPATASVETFYKLQLTGGANGINNGRGQFLEKDISLILMPQE